MTRYVAFLRAVNVGGRVVKMEELKQLFALPGIKNIKTYIQSGNVLFDASGDKDALKKKVEAKLLKELGYEVDTFLRTLPEIDGILNAIPYEQEDGRMNYISFLSAVPDKTLLAPVLEMQNDNEQFCVNGHELYLSCIKGTYGNSVFSNNFFEKKLKLRATTRNQNTLEKILKL